jgi:hypothetical protein
MFGSKEDIVFLKMVNHGKAFRKPLEKILDKKYHPKKDSSEISVYLELEGNSFCCLVDDVTTLQASDSTFKTGKIGLLANIPTIFYDIDVYATKKEIERIDDEKQLIANKLVHLKSDIPKPVLWRKIRTNGYGTARNIRLVT